MILSLIAIFVLMLTLSCSQNSTEPVDSQSPEILIVYPTDSAEVCCIVDIIAEATDNVSVKKVEFHADGEYLNTVHAAPWEYRWDVRSQRDSSQHILHAIAFDEAGNSRGSSPIRVFVDNIRPATISDLAVVDSGFSSVTLSWSSPGDDSTFGIADYYDIRYLDYEITESNWQNAFECDGEPVPRSAGTIDSFKIDFLSNNSAFFFAIKAMDSAGNSSHLSNIAYSRTKALFVLSGTFAGGMNPVSIWSSDLDNDGDNDLAVADNWGDYNPDYNVCVLLNNGNGAFSNGYRGVAGNRCADIVAVDLNDDGFNDLVVGNKASNNCAILFNNGDATFQSPIYYQFGAKCHTLAIADFNNDSYMDIAAANGAESIAILINNGRGLFSRADDVNPMYAFESICSGDFDNDGNYDIAVAHKTGVSILFNNGDSTFYASPYYSIAWNVYILSISSADLDNDGDRDLAVSCNWVAINEYMSVFLNVGGGVFSPAANYRTFGGWSYSISLSDVDCDNYYDIIVTNFFDKNISVFINKNDGTFTTSGQYQLNNWVRYVISDDFDGDGDPDAAVANNSGGISILLNQFYE
jgi:hypothetical protein